MKAQKEYDEAIKKAMTMNDKKEEKESDIENKNKDNEQ